MTIYLPPLSDDICSFPPVEQALDDPDGLLAIGGDLNPLRIRNAYYNGIFPWFSQDEPILWWSPSERATINPSAVHISKSMKRFIKNNHMSITINYSFSEVIQACAQPREKQNETWITSEMMEAYIELHRLGVAHSIEVWHQDNLVGGLYGICIGQVFCGESMFSRMNNVSKLAFIAFNQHFHSFGGNIIDCQMQTAHLKSLGVNALSRTNFIKKLKTTRDEPLKDNCWKKQLIKIDFPD